MKNRIFVAVACLALAALILLLLPSPSAGPSGSTRPWLPNFTRPTPTATASTPPPKEPAAVRLYSCDEAAAAVLTQLAAEYTAATGVEVTVLTPESGNCQTALQAYLESELSPTLLCVHSQSQLEQWQHMLLDLTDTDWAASLYSTDLGMKIDGRLLGIPMALEAYGLLVNAELLAAQGALSRVDFFDMSSLAIGVQILKNNSVKAFPAPELTLLDANYLLQGTDLQAARSFLDLYLTNSMQTGQPWEQFLNAQSAFLLGGSWEYDALAAATDAELHVRNLDIMPTFAAGGMQYLCDSVWCINANARQVDIDATLAFLSWMVTAGENTAAPVDQLQVLTPFRDGAWYGNQLEKKLQDYLRTEGAVLQWKQPERAAISLHQALCAYMESNTDENWDAVYLLAAQLSSANTTK